MWPLYIVPPGLCLDDYRQTCLKCSLFALFISEMLGGRMSHRWFIAWVMDESLDESSHESWMSHRMSHGWVIAWVMDESSYERFWWAVICALLKSSHSSWYESPCERWGGESFERSPRHRNSHNMSHYMSDDLSDRIDDHMNDYLNHDLSDCLCAIMMK
jgi:hypothetical protein